MKLIFRFSFLLIITINTVLSVDAQTTRYVKQTAGGTGDGSSWLNASDNLQQTINNSIAGDEVWVAFGTYKPVNDSTGNPTPSDIKTKTFLLKNGVKVYGSFTGTETTLSQRNFDVNAPTSILSGMLTSSVKAYNVVTSHFADSTTQLNGFAVRFGDAANSRGGGIFLNGKGIGSFCDTKISSCLIESNSAFLGGGLAIDGENGRAEATIENCIIKTNESITFGGGCFITGNPTIINCKFLSNSTFFQGGGVFAYGELDMSILNSEFVGNSCGIDGGAIYFESISEASPKISNSIFRSNGAQNGGAIYFYSAADSLKPALVNCLFYKNVADSKGGALLNNSETSTTVVQPSIVNCTFAINIAPNGKAIYNLSSSFNNFSLPPIIRNSIIWGIGTNVFQIGAEFVGTGDIKSSCVEAGSTTGGNVTFNPFFVDELNDNYLLDPRSALIDAGDNSYLPTTTATDLSGAVRTACGKVDIGAYENQSIPQNYTLSVMPFTPSTHVVKRANRYVLLEPGFEVSAPFHTFTATVDSCY